MKVRRLWASLSDSLCEQLRPSYALALALMMASPLIASALLPRASWYEHLGRPDYQTIIPKAFGDWVDVGDIQNILVTPEQADIIKTIYSQTLSRIYVHRPTGRHVMVSVAHGLDQLYPHEMHWPAVCYSAQGFQIESSSGDQIGTGDWRLKVERMSVSKGGIKEQVTYWMRTGNDVTRGSRELNLARIRLASRGQVADGLLVMISEVSADEQSSQSLQDTFILDLLRAVSGSGQLALVGRTIQ